MLNRIKRYAIRKMNKYRKRKTLIISCGMLRTYKRTSISVLKNVVQPLDADIFFTGPDVVGGVSHRNNKDAGIDSGDAKPDVKYLADIFGGKLVGHNFFPYIDRTSVQLRGVKPFYGINIERIASFMYNIKTAIESVDIDKYDAVIITRPDVAMYRPFHLPDFLGNTLHFNIGEGYDENGSRKLGCAPVCPFVNIDLGMAIGNGDMHFNDQIMIGSQKTIKKLGGLFDNLEKYTVEFGIPPTPETLIAFHMHLIEHVDLSAGDFTSHEIVRDSTPGIRSASNDLFKYYIT